MRVKKYFNSPSLTKQSFKDECDINVIMKRFRKVQGAEFLNRYQGYLDGQFGDFSDVQDYRTALDQIQQARGFLMPCRARCEVGLRMTLLSSWISFIIPLMRMSLFRWVWRSQSLNLVMPPRQKRGR